MIKFLIKQKLVFLILGILFLAVLLFLINKTSILDKYNFDAEIEEKPLEEMLGSNFIVGFMGYNLDEETREIIKYIKPSGIILYARNCKDENQLKDLISDLQEIALDINAYKFFIMIDEEPGGANRLGVFDNAFSLNGPDWSEIYYGTKMMSEVGINVNLAPIADYPFDDNTFIKRRISVKTIEDLIDFNKNFIQISKENNIFTTLKHFPGMGMFVDDPHKDIPSSVINQDIFNKSLLIFKQGIDAGVDFVMTGHAVYENIDSENSATLSSKIVKDILKDQLGFKGIVITDDLSDMPINEERIGRDEVGIKALKSGHHLIMYSHDIKRTKDIFDSILDKAKSDLELQSVIRENYKEIISFKGGNNFSNR